MTAGPADRELAGRIIAVAGERRLTIGVAESLTGGLLGAALTAVPGASEVFRGGIIAYAAPVKQALLGVPAGLLAEHGTVHPAVAAAMAAGARARLGADVAAATTGVAGPDPADGKPPGTVHIAAVAPAAARPPSRPLARSLALAGSREQIREQTVAECLRLLWAALTEETP